MRDLGPVKCSDRPHGLRPWGRFFCPALSFFGTGRSSLSDLDLFRQATLRIHWFSSPCLLFLQSTAHRPADYGLFAQANSEHILVFFALLSLSSEAAQRPADYGLFAQANCEHILVFFAPLSFFQKKVGGFLCLTFLFPKESKTFSYAGKARFLFFCCSRYPGAGLGLRLRPPKPLDYRPTL